MTINDQVKRSKPRWKLAVIGVVIEILVALIAFLFASVYSMSAAGCASEAACNFPLATAAGWMVVGTGWGVVILTIVVLLIRWFAGRAIDWVPFAGIAVIILITGVALLLISISYHTLFGLRI